MDPQGNHDLSSDPNCLTKTLYCCPPLLAISSYLEDCSSRFFWPDDFSRGVSLGGPKPLDMLSSDLELRSKKQ